MISPTPPPPYAPVGNRFVDGSRFWTGSVIRTYQPVHLVDATPHLRGGFFFVDSGKTAARSAAEILTYMGFLDEFHIFSENFLTYLQRSGHQVSIE